MTKCSPAHARKAVPPLGTGSLHHPGNVRETAALTMGKTPCIYAPFCDPCLPRLAVAGLHFRGPRKELPSLEIDEGAFAPPLVTDHPLDYRAEGSALDRLAPR